MSSFRPFALPFDPSRASDNANNRLGNPGWSKSDNWKIKRKQKTRMRNPAAKMEGEYGITIEFDAKNNRLNAWFGKKLIRSIRVTPEMIEKLQNG